MDQTIGIDAGGSLIKIVFEEKGRLHKKKYHNDQLAGAMSWLKMFSENKRIVLTGGKAGKLKSEFFPEAAIVDEFTALCHGAKFLMKTEKMTVSDPFLLINIGTGTSWFAIENNQYKRVLGSGVGGGTFMGLGSLLAGRSDFSELVRLSSNGVRGKVDLLVKDLYHPDPPPIDGELTASNFAQAASIEESSNSDLMASLSNMIAETITLLTVQAAALNQTTRIVFIGSTLAGNSPLQHSLDSYAKMSGLEPVFLINGEFSGAMGARLF